MALVERQRAVGGRHRAQERHAGGRLAPDRLHLIVGGEDQIVLVVELPGRRHSVHGRVVDRGARRLEADRLLLVERDILARVRHENARVLHADVGEIAVHIAVEVRLLRHEDRRLAVAHCPAEHGGHLAAFANAGLVADDEAGTLAEIVDRQRDTVDLLGAEILVEFGFRIAKLLADEVIERPNPLLQGVERRLSGRLHVDRDERPHALAGRFRLVGDLFGIRRCLRLRLGRFRRFRFIGLAFGLRNAPLKRGRLARLDASAAARLDHDRLHGVIRPYFAKRGLGILDRLLIFFDRAFKAADFVLHLAATLARLDAAGSQPFDAPVRFGHVEVANLQLLHRFFDGGGDLGCVRSAIRPLAGIERVASLALGRVELLPIWLGIGVVEIPRPFSRHALVDNLVAVISLDGDAYVSASAICSGVFASSAAVASDGCRLIFWYSSSLIRSRLNDSGSSSLISVSFDSRPASSNLCLRLCISLRCWFFGRFSSRPLRWLTSRSRSFRIFGM